MIAAAWYGLRKRFLKARKKHKQTGEEQPDMAARGPVDVPAMWQRCPGQLGPPERPDFNVNVIEPTLDGRS
jgi:hypothetical protein